MSRKTKKTGIEMQWLAIARDALIRAGVNPSEADTVIDDIPGDHRDLDTDTKQVAFERLNMAEHQWSMG